MLDSDNTRLFQTKINFLLNDGNQLRNENLNLQKLIKLQYSKQTALDQIVLLQCQQKDETRCACSKVTKTNEILVKLFRRTIEENKRLVALIQNIQQERDEALSKALINEQIAEGLEFEEMDLIQSLNEQILTLQATTKQQSDEIVELRQFSGMESPNKTATSKMDDKKVTGRVIELNSLLEKSIEQLNQKTTQVSALEEQKKELIFLNSLLTAEIKQLRASSHKDVNLARIISEQTRLFNDVALTDSSSGNSSYLGEELPNKVNFKKQESHANPISPQINQYIASMQKSFKDSVRNNLLQGIDFKNMSQAGEQRQQTIPGAGGNIIELNSNIQINFSHTLVPALPQEINFGSSDQLIAPKPSNPQLHVVPKLDLTKALKMQQITFKSQLKQEFQKHQMLLQNKIEHKQKQLEKRRLEKGITEQQASQIQQEILQLEEQKLDRSQMLVEENIQLQEKINKLNASLEAAFFQNCQQERHLEQMQRDLNQAYENNSLLINSNLQYEKRWSKIAASFAFFRKYYHQSLLQGHNSTNMATLPNTTDIIFPLQLNSVPSKPSSFTNRQTHMPSNHYAHMFLSPTSASQNLPLSTKSSRPKHFHPYQSQLDQFGQKTFEENDVDNTVFVPLSLRKQSCKKLFRQFHGDSEQIEPFCGQESELMRGEERLSCEGEQQLPHFKDAADDCSWMPPSSSPAEPKNLDEAKSMIFQFAQAIYLNKELTRMTRTAQNTNSVKPRALFVSLQRNIQEKINKTSSKRQKARSVSPKLSTTKLLPYKLLAKYRNVQGLRVFQTKTMTMHNNQKNLKNKQASISNNKTMLNQKKELSQSFSSNHKYPQTLDS